MPSNCTVRNAVPRAYTRRVGVISDGRYLGLLRYDKIMLTSMLVNLKLSSSWYTWWLTQSLTWLVLLTVIGSTWPEILRKYTGNIHGRTKKKVSTALCLGVQQPHLYLAGLYDMQEHMLEDRKKETSSSCSSTPQTRVYKNNVTVPQVPLIYKSTCWYTKVPVDIQKYLLIYKSTCWYTKVPVDIQKYLLIYKSTCWYTKVPVLCAVDTSQLAILVSVSWTRTKKKGNPTLEKQSQNIREFQSKNVMK